MDCVLYVHGLLMTGIESAILARRFAREYRLALEVFHYGSRHEAPAVAAERLAARLEREPGLHVVAHSFGGLIALAALARVPAWRGRAVLLGSPVTGSTAAHGLLQFPGGAWLLGAARRWLTAPPAFAAPPGRVAVIAGTRNLGSGRLLGIGAATADGVVRLAETQLAGAPRKQFRVNHVELLCDRRVAEAAAGFIRAGRLTPA